MEVKIEYCTQWGYLDKALSLRESIEKQYGVTAELIQGTGGVFEVSFNNSLLFSKKELGEITNNIMRHIKQKIGS